MHILTYAHRYVMFDHSNLLRALSILVTFLVSSLHIHACDTYGCQNMDTSHSNRFGILRHIDLHIQLHTWHTCTHTHSHIHRAYTRARTHAHTHTHTAHTHTQCTCMDSTCTAHYTHTSVAQLFGTGGGGGGHTHTHVPTQKSNLYARASEASERLRNIYFQVSKYICTYTMQFPFITYGIALYRHV